MQSTRSIAIGTSLLLFTASASATEVCNINTSAATLTIVETESKERVPLWRKILTGIYDGLKSVENCELAIASDGADSFACAKSVGTLIKDQVQLSGLTTYSRTDVLNPRVGDKNKCSSFGDDANWNIGAIELDGYSMYALMHAGLLSFQAPWPEGLTVDNFMPHAWGNSDGVTFWLDVNRKYPWPENASMYTDEVAIFWLNDKAKNPDPTLKRLNFIPKPSSWPNHPFKPLPCPADCQAKAEAAWAARATPKPSSQGVEIGIGNFPD